MLESLFNKVSDLKGGNVIKKRLQHRCFLVNIAKFLRTPFFTEHLRRLCGRIKKANGFITSSECCFVTSC